MLHISGVKVERNMMTTEVKSKLQETRTTLDHTASKRLLLIYMMAEHITT